MLLQTFFCIFRSNINLNACSSSSSSSSISPTSPIYSTSSISSSSVPIMNHPNYMPDFVVSVSCYERSFDLFTVEAKSPTSNHGPNDQKKIGYELKLMIDQLVDVGVKNPRVCGLWVDGKLYMYTSNNL